jgi:hypothetical protein
VAADFAGDESDVREEDYIGQGAPDKFEGFPKDHTEGRQARVWDPAAPELQALAFGRCVHNRSWRFGE